MYTISFYVNCFESVNRYKLNILDTGNVLYTQRKYSNCGVGIIKISNKPKIYNAYYTGSKKTEDGNTT